VTEFYFPREENKIRGHEKGAIPVKQRLTNKKRKNGHIAQPPTKRKAQIFNRLKQKSSSTAAFMQFGRTDLAQRQKLH
jgi:hypothetical protein